MPFAAVCNTCGMKWGLDFKYLEGKHDIVFHVPVEFDQLIIADGNTVFCNMECRNKYPYNVRVITRGTIKPMFRKIDWYPDGA